MRTRILALCALLLLPVTALAQAPQSRGNLSALGSVQLDVSSMGTASITVSGTYSGTISFEAIGDPGGAAVAVNCATPSTPSTAVTSTTSTGVWTCAVAGLRIIQARMSSYSSGTAVIFITAAPGGGGSGGGGGSNAAAGATAAAVPSSASYTAFNSGGNLTGVSTVNRFPVTCDNCGGGSGGTSLADGGTFTVGTTTATPISGLFESSPTTCTTGKGCAVGLTTNREMKVTFSTALPAGTNGIGKLTANSGVTIGAVEIAAAQTLSTVTTVGAVTSITNALPAGTNGIGKLTANSGVIIGDVNVVSDIPGTGATALGKAIDNAVGATDTGVAMLAQRFDSPTTLTPASGDYAVPRLDSVGRLWMNCATGCSGGTQYTHDAALTIGSSSVTLAGARASAAAPTNVSADDDAVALWALRSGALAVQLTSAGSLVTPGTDYTHDAALTVSTTAGPMSIFRAVSSIPTAVSTADDAVLGAATMSGQGLVVPTAAAFGGADTCYLTSAATTNSTNCKASAGTVYEMTLVNTTATLYYLRLYNLASAPTCSSSTGFVESIPIPASTSAAGVSRTFPVGRAYSTGIGFCLTANGANNDNNAAATGVYLSIGYK